MEKLVGTALLSVALAALIYVPTSGKGANASILASIGFIAFAAGLGLSAKGLKREIARTNRSNKNSTTTPSDS
ncbi:MAG: hypothetical protein M2R45_02346 [Verrucomicrobia subdivision 3 bacterium]|nr:hypothetical protein [Limisphaerales bacterium]MCS1414898.1 hypothetical protein [Limisphaerales bacterium]